MEIISVLKKILPIKFKTFLKKFRTFNSINNLDKKLLKYLNFKDGLYIECGANDGVNQSNTWYYEKTLNWKGVLIEPNKTIFNDLKNNRSVKNIFKNVALVSKDFKSTKKFYLTDDNLQSKITIKNNHTNQQVSVDTLSNILKESGIYKINFFSLDVEGYEFDVLKGINFNIFFIDYILVETKKFRKINLFLKKNFIFIEKLSCHDYLFKNKKSILQIKIKTNKKILKK